MLRPRIIPCLLVHKGGLVKTTQFSNPKYVGDPLNAVRIFNEKEVDELIVLDIDATVRNREPDYIMIRDLAAECRMPLSYGGGIKSVDQVERIISLGVEKAAFSSAAIRDPDIIKRASEMVGAQSIVAVMDVKRNDKRQYELFTYNGTVPTGFSPLDFARKMEDFGVGEVMVNSIDQDGVMKGYDLELVSSIREAVSLPITVLGGAGSLKDIAALLKVFGLIGAAAGSLFVFKGVYKAVLINYPSRADREALYAQTMR